jgi:hypothetical protein
MARWGPLLAVGVAAALAFGPAGATAEDDGPPVEAFAPVVAAWSARDAAGVAAQVPDRGRVSIDLLDAGRGRVTGRVTRVHAEAILKDTFKDVDRVSLRDVTPPGDRGSTRTYDYAYQPRGGEARTTRLSFTMVAGRAGGWALVGIEERLRGP